MGPGRRARAVSSPKTEEFLSRPTGKISIQNRVLGTSPRFNLLRKTIPVGAKALEVGEKSIGKLSIDPDGPAVGPTLAGAPLPRTPRDGKRTGVIFITQFSIPRSSLSNR